MKKNKSNYNFFNFEELFKDNSGIEDWDAIGNHSTEDLKKNLGTFDSDKLCQIVVAYRYLNYNQELAVSAMTELGKRRAAGDNFDFESVIESSLAELPPLNFELPDLRTFITQVAKAKK